MALNGVYTATVNNYIRTELRWTATQNTNNNTSTITASYYLISSVGSANISSSMQRAVSITIDGVTSPYATSSVGLAGGQTKLLRTWTRTINHNANGSKSFSISATQSFGGVVISGVAKYNITASGTGTLNTIPRASSLTSSPSFVAGYTMPIAIGSSSTTFTHTAILYVENPTANNWRTVSTRTGIKSSSTFALTEAELKGVYTSLEGRTTTRSSVRIITYNGGTQLGYKDYYGTCTASGMSTSTSPSTLAIGSNMSGKITSLLDYMTHTIQLIIGGATYTIANRTASADWSYNTSTIASQLYSASKNANYLDGTLRLYTYCSGVQVRTYRDEPIRMTVESSNPIFNATQIDYVDSNSTSLSVTGNGSYIIQGISTVRGKILSVAQPQNGATIVDYTLSIPEGSASRTTIGDSDLGKVNSGGNTSLTVKVTDSRGNHTTVVKEIQVLPWTQPIVNASVSRVASFESETIIGLSGVISGLRVGSSNRNDIVSATYQFKKSTDTAYGTARPLTTNWSPIYPSYIAQEVTEVLDNQSAWDVRITVKDKLGTSTINRTVAVGRPIFFIDEDRKSIGINDYPTKANQVFVNGGIYIGAREWGQGSPSGDGAIKIDGQDGKVISMEYDGHAYIEWSNSGVRQGFMGYSFDGSKDLEVNNVGKGGRVLIGEGRLSLTDGTAWYNNSPVFSSDARTLWTGGSWMGPTQQAHCTKPIADCPNGYVFVWSRYMGNNAQDDSFNYVHVPKTHVQMFGEGKGFYSFMTQGEATIKKYLYLYNSHVIGYTDNNQGDNTKMVLRKILSY